MRLWIQSPAPQTKTTEEKSYTRLSGSFFKELDSTVWFWKQYSQPPHTKASALQSPAHTDWHVGLLVLLILSWRWAGPCFLITERLWWPNYPASGICWLGAVAQAPSPARNPGLHWVESCSPQTLFCFVYIFYIFVFLIQVIKPDLPQLDEAEHRTS